MLTRCHFEIHIIFFQNFSQATHSSGSIHSDTALGTRQGAPTEQSPYLDGTHILSTVPIAADTSLAFKVPGFVLDVSHASTHGLLETTVKGLLLPT